MTLFVAGGLLYLGMELAWRGWTHWAMGIVGGCCLLLIGLINKLYSWDMPLLYQILIGAVIITTLEFTAGCILNLWLNLNIWDYSALPGNILGQICPQFILIWIVLTPIGIFMDDYMRHWIFGEEEPRYKFWPTKE